MEEIMTDPTDTTHALPALRAALGQFKRDQAAASARPPRRDAALAELAPDLDRARAAEDPGRAEADRIRPRLETIMADLHGLLHDPRYSRELAWVDNVRTGLDALLTERDMDAARIRAIAARPFEGYYDVRDARAALGRVADRPRVLRAALDQLEGLYGGLLRRIDPLTATSPPPSAPRPDPPRPTHAISETAA